MKRRWLDNKPWHDESLRTILLQALIIATVASLLGLFWNRWVSDERLPLVRKPVPTIVATPVPTVQAATEESQFLSPGEMPEAKAYEVIDVTQAYEEFVSGEAAFVDARLKEEFKEAHIPGAVNIPSEQFDIYYPEVQHLLPLERPVVVYCIGTDCELSLEVALFMLELGYQKVYMYEGGCPEWKKAGLPLTEQAETPTNLEQTIPDETMPEQKD